MHFLGVPTRRKCSSVFAWLPWRDSTHLQTFGHKNVSFTKQDLSNKTVKR